ncbi:MAG: cell wall-active antibiotics response protein [Thalassotalea sp.]|nr:cell wall-active antibiotics response protein [Thalassotalea sp.]
MSVAMKDRPTQAVRDEVIDQLIMNYSHGELSYEAFERRLDIAMESQDNEEIAKQAEDLKLNVDESYVESKKHNMAFNFEPSSEQGTDSVVSVFGGNKRSGAWKVAGELKVLSAFSGTEIDFTNATFTKKVTTVKVFSLFSGNDIFVPENVNIVSKVFCIFGGVDNDSQTSATIDAPTLVIEGFAIFSGVDISIKQSLKERFVAFADGLKRMFN